MGVLFVIILGPHFCFWPRYCFRNSVKKIKKTSFFDLSQNFKISDPLVVSRQMRSLKTSKTPKNRLMRFFYNFFQNLNFLIFFELFSWKIILSIAIRRRKKVKVQNSLSFLQFFFFQGCYHAENGSLWPSVQLVYVPVSQVGSKVPQVEATRKNSQNENFIKSTIFNIFW